MKRSRSAAGPEGRFYAALLMILAALLLSIAPAMASGLPSEPVGATAEMPSMNHGSGGCADAAKRHKAKSADCLASCLAAMAVMSPAWPVALNARALLHGAPASVETGVLVPSLLAVDPPPPRLS